MKKNIIIVLFSRYSSHYPWANVMANLKSLNKLPSTRPYRVFISAGHEKLMVRSTGVGGFIFPQNGNLRHQKKEEISVDAIFCFVKVFFFF